MAAKPFIVTITGLSGSVESGGLLYSFVRSTSTPRPLYTDLGLSVPATNPVVADALGLISVYFNDALEYSWRAKTADGATTLWEADVVSGVLALTYINPDYSEHPIIEASWVPALGAPLGEGWVEAFADDFAEQTGSVDPLDHGAMGDCVKGSDGVATATDATFTSASLSATSSDVGKVFIAHGAGTGGAPLVTTIASINSPTSIEMATTAVTSVASGCNWTKATNDTVALEAAAAASVASGIPLDLRGRSYGVTQFDLPKNLRMRNGLFIDLAPATNGRQTIRHLGDTTGFIDLTTIKVDRNGGSTITTLYQNQAIQLVNLDAARLVDVEVYGNDSGECIKLNVIDKVHLDVHVHDARYVHSSQTDDVVEAVVFELVTKVSGFVTIDGLGRTDLTSAMRDRFSRGLTLNNAQQLDLSVNISRCEQPIDISGATPSFGQIRGTVRHCYSAGIKLANAQAGLNIGSLTIEHCGRCGVQVTGSNDVETTLGTWAQDILVSGVKIRNIGTNQAYAGGTFDPSGIIIERNSSNSPANQFPKGVQVANNHITSDQGAATFTLTNGSSVVTLQENGFPVSTGTRVRLSTSGSLSGSGFTAGTDYYLIAIPDGITCRLASSYINALDGVAITATGVGTGTHTLTILSDMTYGIAFADLTEDSAHLNQEWGNYIAGQTSVRVLNRPPPATIVSDVASTGQLQGFKNRLINGGFICAQRTAASNADDTYTPLDRWYALTQSNAIAVTQLSNPEDGAPNGARLTQSNASAQRVGIAQIIESINCRDLRGSKAVFMGRVRTSDGGTVGYAVLEWTGSADAVVSDVVNNWASTSYTAGNFFNSTTLSVLATGSVGTTANVWRDLTAILSSVSSSCSNIIVVVWSTATMAQNATLDFNRMQFEPGYSPTRFEQRPYSTELALCQRYFEVGGGNAGPYWSGNTTSGESYVSATAFKVTKRANPTVVLTNVANSGFGATPGTATGNIHGVSENRAATATDVGRLYNSTYTADAEL